MRKALGSESSPITGMACLVLLDAVTAAIAQSDPTEPLALGIANELHALVIASIPLPKPNGCGSTREQVNDAPSTSS